MVNYKIERGTCATFPDSSLVIGIEEEKMEFDVKYKESLINYLNEKSMKDKSNSGTVIGMTVFGVMGLIIFSGTIYFSVVGGVVGMAIGRTLGKRFKKRTSYHSMDQRIMFEMEVILKWAKVQLKKKNLEEKCLVLLIETVILETAYLLEKQDLQKVKNFFGTLRKFILRKDVHQILCEYLPSVRQLDSEDENTVNKWLYRLFTFYVPMLRILEIDGRSHGNFRSKDLYVGIKDYVSSEKVATKIVDLCAPNETIDENCKIDMEPEFINGTLWAAIVADKKSEEFKKLENRVMSEIITNINLYEINIEEDLRRDRRSWCSEQLRSRKMNRSSFHITTERVPECNLRQQRLTLNAENPFNIKNQVGSYELSHEDLDLDLQRKKSDMPFEEEKHLQLEEVKVSPAKTKPKRVVHDDFLDLQMAAEEDVSTWKWVYTDKVSEVYKKKTEGTPMVLIKAIATLEFPKEIVYQAIYDTNIRQQWDKLFHKFEVVENDEEKKEAVLYYVIKAPFGVSNRDFLQKRRVVDDWPKEGVSYMHFKSIVHEEKPKVKRVVRAETILSGYILEQIQDDPPVTKLIIVSQNDIKGLIPKYLVNMASGKAPKKWINNLITGCTDLMNEESSSN